MPIICRPFITLRNGRVLWARECGKKAFCFESPFESLLDYLESKKQKATEQKELENSNS